MSPKRQSASRAGVQKPAPDSKPGRPRRKIRFEGYAEEMLEKQVKRSGNTGRVYLPPEWVGKYVKIIRVD